MAIVVAGALKQQIARWQLPDGHRLTEAALSAEFGVSRSPVREALRLLAAEGYVEILPRAGYRVRQPSLEGIEDLYELRLALELMVVEKLCVRVASGAEDDWSEALRAIPITKATLATTDRAFHEGLARAAGNEAIVSTLAGINDRLAVFREMEAEVGGRPDETREQHQQILDAIVAGDQASAAAAIRRNIVDALANVEALLGNALVRGQHRDERSSIVS
jgi:DNA-binding GntR family transcriptional regulator